MTPASLRMHGDTARGPLPRPVRAAVSGVAALACALTLVAGCATTDTTTWWRPKQPAPPATRPAVVSAPATQTRPAAASQPTDAAQRLATQVQEYVSNLPMDDLQSRLSRHERQPAAPDQTTPPRGEAATPADQAVAPSPVRPSATPAPSPTDTAPPAPQHVPLQPEVIVPTPSPAAPTAKPTPAEPMTASKDTRIVDIEISPAALASAAGKTAEPQPNQPATVKANAGSSAGDLKDLLDQLRKEAAGRPDSVGAALRLRLAAWSLTGQVPSGEDWSLQDAEKRRLAEAVWQVLQVVSKSDALPQQSGGEEFEKALESLGETLRQVQPLKIPNAALCWSVQSFGNYDVLPQPWRFPAGQSNMVVLYCELAGFRSEANKDRPGWYRTLLGERLAILTTDGKELWNYDEPAIEDPCRRPRRDFFVTKKLRIPANLPAARYVLKVTIRDRLANRVAETNLPFEITLGK